MPSASESPIERTARLSRAAADRIRGFITPTPLVRSDSFSTLLSAEVWFKLENRQLTGSFKLRGAANRLLTLDARQRARGCVAASSGNHGAAVAYAMRSLGVNGVIFVPEHTAAAKIEAIREHGGEVRVFGTDGLDTEEHARDFAVENGMAYLSPYNDEAVIAGQGTCGVEILAELPVLDAAFIAVGGGGLISGVGSVLRTNCPDVRVVGCQPLASPVMARSVEAGSIIEMPSEPTLSDGTAGGIEADSITFPLNQAIVDEFVTVDEQEIAAAMREFMAAEGDTIEGAAGVAIAGMLARRETVRERTVVVIICGGNINADRLESVRAGKL